MKQNLNQPLTLEQIAACAGMGVSSFRKHFRNPMYCDGI
jgi:AraC-like DNA-binding protein